MVENLRNHQRYHEQTQQRALLGGSLPHVPDCHELGPDFCRQEEPPEGLAAVPLADAAFADGQFDQAAELYGEALAGGCASCRSESERAWFAAATHRREEERERDGKE